MTRVKCRDCGKRGDEAPDDFAPRLCPDCYRQRMDKITPMLEAKMDRLLARPDFDGNITPVIAWLAEALETIAGETHQAAREHANYLGHQIVLMNNQQDN